MRLRMKNPAPQQNSTPTISSTLQTPSRHGRSILTGHHGAGWLLTHSPEVPQPVDGQNSDAAAGPTAVLVGAAAATTGRLVKLTKMVESLQTDRGVL